MSRNYLIMFPFFPSACLAFSSNICFLFILLYVYYSCGLSAGRILRFQFWNPVQELLQDLTTSVLNYFLLLVFGLFSNWRAYHQSQSSRGRYTFIKILFGWAIYLTADNYLDRVYVCLLEQLFWFCSFQLSLPTSCQITYAENLLKVRESI